MKRLALAAVALGLSVAAADAQASGAPLVFGRMLGTWQVEITGIGPDGERATRTGTETCRWTAGGAALLCEATFDAFGVPLHETRLLVAQAATGAITRTTANSHGLAITARCRSPQPNLLLCEAEVPTGDASRSTHLRDTTRLGGTHQAIDWDASRDRRKTWSPVGHGEKRKTEASLR